MHPLRGTLLLLLPGLLLATACDRKAPEPTGGPPAASRPDGTAPAPDMEPREGKGMGPEVTVKPGGPDSPGGHQVLSDGMAVWPPTGPGCEGLVACCRAAAAAERAMGLACQLAVARPRVDCGRALSMVKRLMGERMMALPAECAVP